MGHQEAVIKKGPHLTIVLSCAETGLQLRLARTLKEAGHLVTVVELSFPAVLHRIYQLQAQLLILQTNTGKTCEEEIRRCHLLNCKVLWLETHALLIQPFREKPDAVLTLPVDPESVLGMIRCLFFTGESDQTPPLTLAQLLERWQVTDKQPNRRMIEQTVLLTVAHPQWMQHITKYIYPRLARQNRLTVSAVEQRLRRMVFRLYDSCQDELFRALFPSKRPSNSRFFIQVARYLTGFQEQDDENENAN